MHLDTKTMESSQSLSTSKQVFQICVLSALLILLIMAVADTHVEIKQYQFNRQTIHMKELAPHQEKPTKPALQTAVHLQKFKNGKQTRIAIQNIHFDTVEDEMKYIDKMLFGNKTKIKRLPKLLVIGAKKCGTATLNNFLSANPYLKGNLFTELFYFDAHYKRGEKWYRSQMVNTTEDQIAYETSSTYSHKPIIPERVYKLNPKMYLILIVCDPVQRLISEYVHNQAHPGREDNFRPFSYFFINSTTAKIRTYYKERLRIGMYYKTLKMWEKYFPLERIKIVDATQFVLNPVPQLQDIERFLDIPRYIKQRLFKKGPKGFYCLNTKEGCMRSNKGRTHPNISERVISVLRKYYKPFNRQFFKYINRTMDWGY